MNRRKKEDYFYPKDAVNEKDYIPESYMYLRTMHEMIR